MAKCYDCGFLAVRNEKTRELVEMELGYRNTGECPREIDSVKHPNIYGYEYPLCFKLAYNLGEEMKNLTGSPGEKIRPVIQRDRACEPFAKWRQGFTPKEHQEMLDREKLMEWQKEREEDDRKWHRKEQWQLVIVAGIFTLLGVIITWVLTGA